MTKRDEKDAIVHEVCTALDALKDHDLTEQDRQEILVKLADLMGNEDEN